MTARRLNRQEYEYTVLDLLDVEAKVARSFPVDDSGYGFDNIGDVLSISPLLMEKYMSAAEEVVSAAVERELAPSAEGAEPVAPRIFICGHGPGVHTPGCAKTIVRDWFLRPGPASLDQCVFGSPSMTLRTGNPSRSKSDVTRESTTFDNDSGLSDVEVSTENSVTKNDPSFALPGPVRGSVGSVNSSSLKPVIDLSGLRAVIL